jgi:hypothetical protein
MSWFKYVGTRVANRNFIQEEIKRRLNSAQNLSFCLMSKSLTSKMHMTIFLPVILYGSKTLSLIFKGGMQTEGV